MKTAYWAYKNLGRVTGVRLLKELKGKSAKDLEKELTVKKMISTARMFGRQVQNIHDIKEAVASYTSKAAEKLRRQKSAANTISVFVVVKKEGHKIDFNRGVTTS